MQLHRRKTMIKEKQLNDDLMTIKVGKAQSLAELKEALEKISSENQIPMLINTDILKTGGLLNSKERECLVIKMRYYHGLTQARVASVLDVSQVQVSRIEKKALARLKECLKCGY